MADPSTAESQELVRFPDVPKPPGLDEKEQYAVMLAAAKQRGGLRTGEDLTALPAGTPGPGGAWKSGGTITAASGTVYDVYTRDPAPEPPTPSDTSASTPPGSDALQDVDKNFSPGPPDDTVAKCVTGFAEGFVEGFAVGYAVGFLLGALGPVGAVIGVGLLLYSAYQVVTNWDKIKAAPPEEKARMIGGLAGGILGGGMGGRAGSQFRETITEPLGEGAGGGEGEGYGPGKMPEDPNDLLRDGWQEVTDPRNTSGSREFVNPKTGMKVRYDPGTLGDPGFGGKNHYHVENPDSTGKADYYLDKDGNPVPKGSKPSHILPNDKGGQQ